jgi:hypothetical protein
VNIKGTFGHLGIALGFDEVVKIGNLGIGLVIENNSNRYDPALLKYFQLGKVLGSLGRETGSFSVKCNVCHFGARHLR